MTCRDFDSRVMDFVRGVPMATGIRSEVEAHAGDCTRCRAHLASEQELSGGLGQMARDVASLEAPVHIQQTLLKAFREHQQRVTPAPALFTPGWRGRLALVGAAAAAAVAVAFWVGSNRVAPPLEKAPEVVASDPAPEPVDESPVPDGLVKQPVAEKPQTSAHAEEPKRASRPTIAPRRKQLAATAVSTNEPKDPAASVTSAAPPAREITTDFLPLAYGDDFRAHEGAKLVRVRLPGDAPAYFGLPVHGLSSESIPADVLLGEDGTARAIRFVRYASPRDAGMRREPSF